MNKKILMSLVLLTIIGTSVVFAQSINGIWVSQKGNVDSIFNGKGVITETVDSGWKEVERRGHIGIGSPVYRNIRSTGKLTWSGEALAYNNSTYATSWYNCTFTLNANGQTLQVQVQNSGAPSSYTRKANTSLDGIWVSQRGNVDSIFDAKGVIAETVDSGWKEVERRGHIGIGSPVYRNIRSTDKLTWSGQALAYNNSTYATSWYNCTFILSEDGQTLQVQVQNSGAPSSYTRIQ